MYIKKPHRLFSLFVVTIFLFSSAPSYCFAFDLFSKKEPVNEPFFYKYFDITKEFIKNNKGLSVGVPAGAFVIFVSVYCVKKVFLSKGKKNTNKKHKKADEKSILKRLILLFFRTKDGKPKKRDLHDKKKNKDANKTFPLVIPKKGNTKESKKIGNEKVSYKKPLEDIKYSDFYIPQEIQKQKEENAWATKVIDNFLVKEGVISDNDVLKKVELPKKSGSGPLYIEQASQDLFREDDQDDQRMKYALWGEEIDFQKKEKVNELVTDFDFLLRGADQPMPDNVKKKLEEIEC